jgi:hypothetical protein
MKAMFKKPNGQLTPRQQKFGKGIVKTVRMFMDVPRGK